MDILREKIADDRFINLIRKFLSAGYLENWVYHRTHSGTPQGSVISPILTNVYLSKLDNKLETLRQAHSQGPYRKRNVAHIALMQARKDLLKQGETDPSCRDHLQGQLHRLNQEILRTPAAHYDDPAYARRIFPPPQSDNVLISRSLVCFSKPFCTHVIAHDSLVF